MAALSASNDRSQEAATGSNGSGAVVERFSAVGHDQTVGMRIGLRETGRSTY
jgi:hypothetical protein